MTSLNDILELASRDDFADKYSNYKSVVDSLESLGVLQKQQVRSVYPDPVSKHGLVVGDHLISKYEIANFSVTTSEASAKQLSEKLHQTDLQFQDMVLGTHSGYIRIEGSWDHIEGGRDFISINYAEKSNRPFFGRLLRFK